MSGLPQERPTGGSGERTRLDPIAEARAALMQDALHDDDAADDAPAPTRLDPIAEAREAILGTPAPGSDWSPDDAPPPEVPPARRREIGRAHV